MSRENAEPSAVDCWVDPLCPWAWSTARWLFEVEQVRDVEVRLHLMSLAVLNEGRDDVDRWYQFLARRGWGPVRVCAAAAREYGPDVLRPLYAAMATRIHERSEGWGAGMLTGALEQAGLDPVLAEAARSAEHDDAVRASHRAGVEPVGPDAGTPVTHLRLADGTSTAFFGPVLMPAPTGPQAGRLWDAVATMAGVAGFAEFKRPRPRLQPARS